MDTSSGSDNIEPARVRRVVLVGGESTGKTTLVTGLQAHYGCPVAGEFARDYLSSRGADYDLEQSLVLAQGQLGREDAAVREAQARGERLVICDTDALTTMLWAEHYFGAPHPQVPPLIEDRRYDLHLLCSPEGLAWDDDGLRQSPHSRAWFTQRFREQLDQRGYRYVELDQPPAQRLAAAVAAIDQVLGMG